MHVPVHFAFNIEDALKIPYYLQRVIKSGSRKSESKMDILVKVWLYIRICNTGMTFLKYAINRKSNQLIEMDYPLYM